MNSNRDKKKKSENEYTDEISEFFAHIDKSVLILLIFPKCFSNPLNEVAICFGQRKFNGKPKEMDWKSFSDQKKLILQGKQNGDSLFKPCLIEYHCQHFSNDFSYLLQYYCTHTVLLKGINQSLCHSVFAIYQVQWKLPCSCNIFVSEYIVLNDLHKKI